MARKAKTLGDKIESRIRDNGNGIPVDIREKIFQSFLYDEADWAGYGLGIVDQLRAATSWRDQSGNGGGKVHGVCGEAAEGRVAPRAWRNLGKELKLYPLHPSRELKVRIHSQLLDGCAANGSSS